MVINVAQFLKDEVGATRLIRLEEIFPSLDDEIQLTTPIQGIARLTRTNRGILVRAQLATAVRLECSRCLELFVDPLAIEFYEEYVPVVDVETGAPTNIPRDGHTYIINERHDLDFTEAVREYGLLALPMKPLCQVNCAGLCRHCGTNLNADRCRCVEDVLDGRFAVLRSLLPYDNASN